MPDVAPACAAHITVDVPRTPKRADHRIASLSLRTALLQPWNL